MTLWQEVLDFKGRHNLYFHPRHLDTVENRVNEIEKNGRRCPCFSETRKCICPEALAELASPRMSCHCLLFVTEDYIKKWYPGGK